MDQEIVVHPHSEILLRNKKELTANTCNNMGEFQKHYAKSKKLGSMGSSQHSHGL